MEPKITQPWMKGIMISLAFIALSLVFQFTDLSQNKYVQWTNSLLLIAAIAWASYNYAQQKQGNVTFGNIFSHGFKTTAALTAILVVYTFISIKFLFPELVEKSLEEARKQMEKGGNLSESDIEKGLEMTKKFFLPFAVGGSLVVYLILGTIGSLIGSAISKKNPNPTPFEQQ
ncbi:MAG: DUF4199 domain-containing protein [Chitinophagaceae bacterium]|nr:DUF4199 domain-containing protein [Chitinophagaceae bacterium]